jgi:NAD(P)-dependent dehydrogenase (short-subunit alcohol dehydrogenase family)
MTTHDQSVDQSVDQSHDRSHDRSHERGALPRTAIVTGADSGIGRATALLLATEGFDIGLTVHSDVTGAEETARAISDRGQRCVRAPFDAASPDAGDTIDRLAEQLGGLGVLVNVAGTGQSERALEISLEQWRSVIDTDLTGPFLTAQRAARRMIDAGHGGRIINVTSVHEHVPRLGAAAYCAAKAGLGMLTKVLALELAEHGITVNAVAPGEIATEMTGQQEQDAYSVSRPGNPIGRPGHVNEVASVIGFLASPRSSYVTGSSYAVDGGLMLMAAHGHDEAGTGWRSL